MRAWQGLSGPLDAERLVLIRPPAFFTDCAQSTATAVHNCLTEGFTEECAVERVCAN